MSKPYVLIVEDEPDLLDLFVEEIVDFGWAYLSAKSGNEACEIFAQQKNINIIISDMQMPDGNGLELIKRLKRSDDAKNLIFVFITGQSLIGEREGHSLGALTFFQKPVNYDAVFATIEHENLRLNNKLHIEQQAFNAIQEIEVFVKNKKTPPLTKVVNIGKKGFSCLVDDSYSFINGDNVMFSFIFKAQKDTIVFDMRGSAMIGSVIALTRKSVVIDVSIIDIDLEMVGLIDEIFANTPEFELTKATINIG